MRIITQRSSGVPSLKEQCFSLRCSEWLRAKQDAADAELKEAQQAALEEQDFVGPEPLPAEERAGGLHGYGGALRPGAASHAEFTPALIRGTVH